jgi:hypothetical protein
VNNFRIVSHVTISYVIAEDDQFVSEHSAATKILTNKQTLMFYCTVRTISIEMNRTAIDNNTASSEKRPIHDETSRNSDSTTKHNVNTTLIVNSFNLIYLSRTANGLRL